MYSHVPRLVRLEDVCAAVADGRPVLDVLPAEVSEVLRDAPGPLVMIDFAGRDSVAAALAWMDGHTVGTLLPIADVVPTRYGDWSVYEENWQATRAHIARRHPSVVFAPWFVMEDVDAWRLLNGRYLNELIATFGFFTPCLGCHLHFYLMRAILGRALGAHVLVSGEKELHGRKRKANQTQEAVESYARFGAAVGIQHAFPIHKVTTEDEMHRLLGDDWREGERQLPCVMSGNDQGLDGELTMTGEQIAAYMERFALPVATRLVELRQQRVAGPELQRSIDVFVKGMLARSPS